VKLDRIRYTKETCFLSYMEDRSNDKHVYKNKHDHIETQLWTLFVTVEPREREKGKENHRASVILQEI
jgi:hypothetical protein